MAVAGSSPSESEINSSMRRIYQVGNKSPMRCPLPIKIYAM
jgi:hypothetical protein